MDILVYYSLASQAIEDGDIHIQKIILLICLYKQVISIF